MELKKNIVDKLKFEIYRIDNFVNKLIKKNKQAGLIRLLIFFLTIILFFVVYSIWGTLHSVVTLAMGFIIFGIATQVHNNLTSGLKRITYWKNFKVEQLARAQLDWNNIPYLHENKENYEHNFSADLNISGEKSLMHLIDQAVSDDGSKILFNYLTNETPEHQVLVNKQELIKELLPLQNFRSKLLLNIKLSSKNILNSQKLLNSFKSNNNEIKIKKVLNILFVLYLLNIVLVLGSLFFHWPSFWTISLLLYIAVNWFNIKYISDLYEKVEEVEKDLGVYYNIFNYLESYNYGSNKKLKDFCSAFTYKNTPSLYFKKLKNLNYAFSVQKNDILVLIFNLLFPWAFFWGYKFEKIKNKIAEHLPVWIKKWNELEAYISLANFAYLNPYYTFPEFSNDNCFSAENISHPLLIDDVKISNTFSSSIGEISIITGSNMSGKSTFLKTLGINIALAYAGAPVNAAKMKLNLYRLFTCINITDSLIDGISFFYAEVRRLKKLLNNLEKENELPVFYLIDEIFKGTNNVERLIGSKNLILYLSSKNGVGVISTHDLELIKLADDSIKILNYHFREEIRDNKMYFDYKLKQGGSPTTNALKIMILGGLPINE